MTTPAKSVRSAHWFCRFDGTKEVLTTKCAELESAVAWMDVVRWLAVYHTGKRGENPHIHFIMELHGQIQKQSFDVRAKKYFDIEKKSDYSTKHWDGNLAGAGSYLFSDKDAEILRNKGFTEAELSEMREANDKVQEIVVENKKRASGKLVDKAMEWWAKENGGRQYRPSDQFKVFRYMMTQIRDGQNWHPGMFQIKKYCEEITIKLTDENHWADYVEQQYNQLFRVV